MTCLHILAVLLDDKLKLRNGINTDLYIFISAHISVHTRSHRLVYLFEFSIFFFAIRNGQSDSYK